MACLDEQAALVARTRKRYSEAVEHYSAAVELRLQTSEYQATLYNERALAHYQLGQHLNVIWDSYMSLALKPTALLPVCIRGRSFRDLGYYSHALAVRRSSYALYTPVTTVFVMYCLWCSNYCCLKVPDHKHHQVVGCCRLLLCLLDDC